MVEEKGQRWITIQTILFSSASHKIHFSPSLIAVVFCAFVSGYQRLDLLPDSNNPLPVKGQIVISLLSRDGHGTGKDSKSNRPFVLFCPWCHWLNSHPSGVEKCLLVLNYVTAENVHWIRLHQSSVLHGSAYPSFTFFHVNKNTIGYTGDQCCHLKASRALLVTAFVAHSSISKLNAKQQTWNNSAS